jgi:tetraacyldisaccharide 4'-kinase
MKAPEFWSQPGSLLGKLLSPLGCAYSFAGTLKRARVKSTRVDATIVCVGNIVTGGAGKTPVALAIAAILQRDDLAFLTRGYGGRLPGPTRVAQATHTHVQVGDEALLLTRAAPTWVARDRVAGARAAMAAGARLIVMDDGFQNPSLAKDVSLVVIDGAIGFGNGQRIPAGPLREPVAAGLARADAVVISGEDRAGIIENLPPSLPVFTGRTLTTTSTENWAGRRAAAFAGIGRPEKFFDTLAALGCEIVATRSFADHHRFTDREIAQICAEANALNAAPVTTEKDAVRLPRAARDKIETLPVAFVWDNVPAITAFLDKQTRRQTS